MNLTIDMMSNLKKHGFTFEQFEHDCNPGMVYYYDNCEYILGGRCDGTPCSDEDQMAAQKGQWLPDESHLMLWLQWKLDYDVTVEYVADKRYFYGTAKNTDVEEFKGSGPDLLCCLYKLILKICKHNQSRNSHEL